VTWTPVVCAPAGTDNPTAIAIRKAIRMHPSDVQCDNNEFAGSFPKAEGRTL
jgi:hypothetical protein